jgi:hypothetical protein
MKKRIQQQMKDLKQASRVQVVFLLDCTGSMSSHMKSCKDNIQQLQSRLMKEIADADVQIAFCGYRDVGDDIPQTLDFTNNAQAFAERLKIQVPTGGGDEAEQVHEGLERVTQLKWDKNVYTKILFHIGDAPCHGKFFAGKLEIGDSYKDFDADGKKASNLLKTIMKDSNVKYVFLEVTDRTRPMIDKFNELIAKVDPKLTITTHPCRNAGEIMDIAYEKTFTVAMESIKASKSLHSSNVAKEQASLKDKIVDRIKRETKIDLQMKHSNLFDCMEEKSDGNESDNDNHINLKALSLQSPAKKMADFKVGQLDPAHQGFQFVQRITFALPTSIKSLMLPLTLKKPTVRSVKVSGEQFCKGGAFRNVYKTEMVDKYQSPSSSSSGPESSAKMKNCLTKVHQTFSSLEDDQMNMKNDLEIQTICAYLCRQFMELEPIKNLKQKLRFLKASGIRFLDSAKPISADHPRGIAARERYAGLEEILHGGEDYQKWTNNALYVDQEAEPILLAFIHWTWHVTDGYMMVCDIQGIETKKDEITEFVLTDPCLHCKDVTRYTSASSTNLGESGMDMYFKTHKCNHICKQLKLNPFKPSQDMIV